MTFHHVFLRTRAQIAPIAIQFSLVQLLSHIRLRVIPWIAARQASLSITHLPEFTQTHVY